MTNQKRPVEGGSSSKKELKVKRVRTKKKKIRGNPDKDFAATFSAWKASCRRLIIGITRAQPLVPAARPVSAHWGSIKMKSLYNLSAYCGELKELLEIIYKLLYTNCLQAVNDA